MRRLFEIGGYVAAVLLLALGVVALVLGLMSRTTIQDNLAVEMITGTPDMTPAAITKEARSAGLNVSQLDIPTESLAGETIDTGAEAKVFAQYMRIHALEATGGRVYSEMGRYVTASGQETNDPAEAAKDANGQPQANQARDIWVTWTALATALNVSYFGTQVALFSILVAVALIVAGIGFGVLAYSAFRWLPARAARGTQATDETGESEGDAAI
jgi:hypothetical protein